jgi:hypothetical protein
MKKLIALSIILLTGNLHATIYVNQNASGGTEYTDTPSMTSKPVVVPPANSISTPSPAASTSAQSTQINSTANETTDSASADAATSQASSYKTFEIISPKNEETLQNQPIIPVEMNIEPNMLPGDKIQLMLDGKPAGTPTATAYQELGIVERGTHTLYAVIVNNKGQNIKQTSTITIYIHRASTINSPAAR